MGHNSDKIPKKSEKPKKSRSRVTFEEEVIIKQKAKEVLSNMETIETCQNTADQNLHEMKNEKFKKGKSSRENIHKAEDVHKKDKNLRLSKKKTKIINAANGVEQVDESSECKRKIDDSEECMKKKAKLSNQKELPDAKENTEESKRSKKKRKHNELLERKKEKIGLVTKENVLNYLSKWKHCKNEWKFEKLKQIWLSENIYDSTKIPDEFWETTVDYFSESKGFIRKLLLRDALKIVEMNNPEENQIGNDCKSELKRARDIVQSLQE